MKPKVLAVVPARAGSKRLPKKNIKLLKGKPLISYTFDAIQQSDFITTTIATSDCPQVLRITEQYADIFPLLRPAELASDTASSIDVLKHAENYARQFGNFDIICLLQPTSPLRTATDIDGAIALYIDKKAKGVVSMSECEHSPLWSTLLNDENDFNKFIKQLSNARSQDLAKYYQLNGAIYLIDKETFLKKGVLFLDKDYYPYIMPAEHSVDIDSEVDFIKAEALIKCVNFNC